MRGRADGRRLSRASPRSDKRAHGCTARGGALYRRSSGQAWRLPFGPRLGALKRIGKDHDGE